jgi:hypothetical protein
MLRRLRRPIRIVILITSNKIESYSHLLYLLSHTTVQSTATSEIELRGDITQFRFFLAISSLMTSISEVAVLYLTFQGFRLFFKKLDRSVYAGTSSLERCDHVAPQWSYSFTKGYFFQKKITRSASLSTSQWWERSYNLGIPIWCLLPQSCSWSSIPIWARNSPTLNSTVGFRDRATDINCARL